MKLRFSKLMVIYNHNIMAMQEMKRKGDRGMHVVTSAAMMMINIQILAAHDANQLINMYFPPSTNQHQLLYIIVTDSTW